LDFFATSGCLWNELNGAALIQSIQKQPLDRRLLSDIQGSMEDLSWYANVVATDRLIVAEMCINAPQGFPENYLGFSWRPFQRLRIIRTCQGSFLLYSHWLNWINTMPDFKKDQYCWKQANSTIDYLIFHSRIDSSITNPNDLIREYEMLLRLITQEKQILAIDSVLRFYQYKRLLPVGIEDIPDSWPMDPFSDKPIRYERLSGLKFRVFSIGRDEFDCDNKPYPGDDIVFCMDMNDR
jgi:hypothetical protein